MEKENNFKSLVQKKISLEDEMWELAEINNECITERLAARDPFDKPGEDELARSKRIDNIRTEIKNIEGKIHDLQY